MDTYKTRHLQVTVYVLCNFTWQVTEIDLKVTKLISGNLYYTDSILYCNVINLEINSQKINF